ncbi:MAG: succinate dehydrogenase, cytochrome b556 subunit [Pseudomonadota bacterium]
MADVNRGNRPLSPHLTIYRPQITSISSILTRITGNALLLSALLIVWWFLAAATGPEAFALADWVLTSWIGSIVMSFSVLGFWYHFLAGLRHLYWDSGRGLDVATSELMGKGAMIGSVVLTALTLLVI